MSQLVEQTWEEEVLSRGMQRGTLLARRSDLRALLELRFGALPQTVVQRIEETEDVERLRACLLQVHQLKTLDELPL